jgi:hypothetical protein
MCMFIYIDRELIDEKHNTSTYILFKNDVYIESRIVSPFLFSCSLYFTTSRLSFFLPLQSVTLVSMLLTWSLFFRLMLTAAIVHALTSLTLSLSHSLICFSCALLNLLVATCHLPVLLVTISIVYL